MPLAVGQLAGFWAGGGGPPAITAPLLLGGGKGRLFWTNDDTATTWSTGTAGLIGSEVRDMVYVAATDRWLVQLTTGAQTLYRMEGWPVPVATAVTTVYYQTDNTTLASPQPSPRALRAMPNEDVLILGSDGHVYILSGTLDGTRATRLTAVAVFASDPGGVPGACDMEGDGSVIMAVGTAPGSVQLRRSADGGLTWTTPTYVASVVVGRPTISRTAGAWILNNGVTTYQRSTNDGLNFGPVISGTPTGLIVGMIPLGGAVAAGPIVDGTDVDRYVRTLDNGATATNFTAQQGFFTINPSTTRVGVEFEGDLISRFNDPTVAVGGGFGFSRITNVAGTPSQTFIHFAGVTVQPLVIAKRGAK